MSPILGIYASANFRLPSSYESIATTTVGSGGAANVEFTSIPATYTHLQIRFIARDSGNATGEINAQFNSDTASNYSFHQIYGSGTSVAASGNGSTAYTKVGEITGTSYNASIFGVGIIDILDYKDTNKYKTVRSLTGEEHNTSFSYLVFISGNWRSTSAITTIKLTPTNTFGQYSQFALYGIKN